MDAMRNWHRFQTGNSKSNPEKRLLIPENEDDFKGEILGGRNSTTTTTIHVKQQQELLGRGSYRERIRFYLDRSALGRWWDLMDVFINLCFVGSYIYLTYFSIGERNQENHPPPAPNIYLHLDATLSFLLLINWLPSIYLAFDPWHKLMFEFYSHLSLWSSLPPLYIWIIRGPNDPMLNTLMSAGDTGFVYPLRFWRLHYSIMKVLQPDSNAIIVLGRVARKALQLAVSIFSTLSTVTAWVHICLYRVQHYYDLTFFDVFYTITVTATSGLSTQIVPDNIFSRIITIGVKLLN